MKVTVNGEEREIEPGTTVRELVERLGLGSAACAVEVNRSLVPRREHETAVIKEGDTVELVTLVGGG